MKLRLISSPESMLACEDGVSDHDPVGSIAPSAPTTFLMKETKTLHATNHFFIDSLKD